MVTKDNSQSTTTIETVTADPKPRKRSNGRGSNSATKERQALTARKGRWTRKEDEVLIQGLVTHLHSKGIMLPVPIYVPCMSYAPVSSSSTESEATTTKRIETTAGGKAQAHFKALMEQVCKGQNAPWLNSSKEFRMELNQAIRQCPWSKILAPIPHRTVTQATARWGEALDPRIKKGRWELREDELLMQGYRSYGHCWIRIAEAIEGRTQRQCRTRWIQLAKRPVETTNQSGGNPLVSESMEEDSHLTSEVTKEGNLLTSEVTEKDGLLTSRATGEVGPLTNDAIGDVSPLTSEVNDEVNSSLSDGPQSTALSEDQSPKGLVLGDAINSLPTTDSFGLLDKEFFLDFDVLDVPGTNMNK